MAVYGLPGYDKCSFILYIRRRYESGESTDGCEDCDIKIPHGLVSEKTHIPTVIGDVFLT